MKYLFYATLALGAIALTGCSSPATPTTTSGGGPQSNSTTSGSADSAKKAFSDIVITDDEATKAPKTEFSKDTPKIFVFFGLDVPTGSKIQGTWIAEKTDKADPNYKIDEAALEIGAGVNTGNFSLSKPTAGWPAGDYRVELAVDSKVVETVKFTIK